MQDVSDRDEVNDLLAHYNAVMRHSGGIALFMGIGGEIYYRPASGRSQATSNDLSTTRRIASFTNGAARRGKRPAKSILAT